MKTSLSKSRYTKYCQCAKALWLSVNKSEEATVDAGVEARFTEGNVVASFGFLIRNNKRMEVYKFLFLPLSRGSTAFWRGGGLRGTDARSKGRG